jgi:hypothetical protein
VTCTRDAECAIVDGLPAGIASIVQSGPSHYIASTATASYDVNVTNNSIEELVGAGPGVIGRLEDGSLIRYEHLASHSRVLRRRGGDNWSVILEYDKLRAYEFRFLPDGRHLFKTSPGMGKAESPYFVDLIIGQPTHLHVVDELGKKPRHVHSSTQQMDAEFLDGGRRIAFWQPGEIDKATNRRTISLQVLDLANNAITNIDTVTTPLKNLNGGTRRDAPEASSSIRSTWIVHAHELAADFRTTMLRADDVATRNHVELRLAADEQLFAGIPNDSHYPHRHTRRWSDQIVIGKRLGHVTELAVIAIPSLAVVLRTRVPTQGLYGAEWVDDP